MIYRDQTLTIRVAGMCKENVVGEGFQIGGVVSGSEYLTRRMSTCLPIR